MADVTKSEKTLSITGEFTDGDDRKITMPNPRNNLTWADIEALNASASAVLIGDRAAANFYRFKDAEITERSVTTYDLT